jgi:hypothetical protein
MVPGIDVPRLQVVVPGMDAPREHRAKITPVHQVQYRPEADTDPSDVYLSIKAQNKMKRLPAVLDGTGTNPKAIFTECGSFYNKGDNRVARSVVKEDICTGTVTSLSFSPQSWLCLSCPVLNSEKVRVRGEGGAW